MLALARPAAASFSMSAVELFPSDDLVFFFQARAARRRDRDGRALSLSRSLTISRALSLSRPPRARARDPPNLSPPPRSRARSLSTSRPPRRLSRRASSREQHCQQYAALVVFFFPMALTFFVCVKTICGRSSYTRDPKVVAQLAYQGA